MVDKRRILVDNNQGDRMKLVRLSESEYVKN